MKIEKKGENSFLFFITYIGRLNVVMIISISASRQKKYNVDDLSNE